MIPNPTKPIFALGYGTFWDKAKIQEHVRQNKKSGH